MAIVNPSTLYSGGNVRLDSTPYLRLALQERARNEARGQAIDQYYQKLPETINDKGVRDQEVPIIGDLKNQMVQTYIENRDALRKGDPTAQMKMNQLFRKSQSIARESQNASKIDMALGTMALNKDNQPILNNEGFIQRHSLHNLPVTDPNYKPIDISEEMANRPFNPQSYAKDLQSNIKYSQGIPTITPHPTDKNLEVVTTNPVLDDQTKQNLYAGAAYKLHNDISFKNALQKNYSTPEQIAPLNEISKKVFGHEITKPEDIAAAYSASLLPSQTTRASVKASVDAKNEEWDRRNAIQFKQRQDLAAFNSRLIQGRKSAEGTPEGTIGFPTDEINKQYGEDLTLQKNGVKENKRIVRVGNVPSTILETINPIDINKQKYGVDAFDGKDADGKAFKYYEVAPDGLVGKNGKIGRNDAQALYIDKFGNTKVKVAHGNKGLITTPTGGTTKKGKYD